LEIMAKPPIVTLVVGVALAVGCAEPNPFLPPPVEVVVVANTMGPSLTVLPVATSGPGTTIPLSGSIVNTTAALGPVVLASLPMDDAADVLHLGVASVVMTVGLPAGSGATGVAVVSDTIAYAANPNLNSITQINLTTGDTASLTVGVYPQGLVSTRGSLFVLNGNVSVCGQPGGLCSLGSSWLTVVDPVTNSKATGTDSIPLIGPGNARYVAVGRDGLLYVMSRGTGTDSRLSIVDPVGRREIASFGGFGQAPGQMASDPGERILISSLSEGVMVFNTRTRSVERGAGNGVAIPENSGIAVDFSFRVYAVQSGDCAGANGQTTVLDSTLAPIRTAPAGPCAGDALVTLLPAGAAP